MNRAPSKSDPWWSKHQDECGGTYTKIAEPELSKAQINALSAKERAGLQKNKIDGWIRKSAARQEAQADRTGRSSDTAIFVEDSYNTAPSEKDVCESGNKRPFSIEDVETATKLKKLLVSCPICDSRIEEAKINQHLDAMHADP
jgi:hypothetical protein